MKNKKIYQEGVLRARELRRSETAAEKKVWELLRNRKFMNLKFLRQHPIYFDDEGNKRFILADFYCHKLKLILEIDGKIHDARKDEDLWRDEKIKERGIQTIRVRNEEIEKLEWLLRELIPRPLLLGREGEEEKGK